ncbi:hypothetical protein ACC730_38595, partial [Rhizobium ruizarguesonis]
LSLVADSGRGIGTALANLVNITDPEVIVAGGEAVSLGDPFLTPTRLAMSVMPPEDSKSNIFWVTREAAPRAQELSS